MSFEATHKLCKIMFEFLNDPTEREEYYEDKAQETGDREHAINQSEDDCVRPAQD